MPIYEYGCNACGHDFEAIVRSSAAAPPPCPSCGSDQLSKRLSVPAAAQTSGARSTSLPVCAPSPAAGNCGAMGCGGGFCAMDN